MANVRPALWFWLTYLRAGVEEAGSGALLIAPWLWAHQSKPSPPLSHASFLTVGAPPRVRTQHRNSERILRKL